MRSLIIVEVEHGDSTDLLDDVLWQMGLEGYIDGRPDGVIDYTVKVDIPECFTL